VGIKTGAAIGIGDSSHAAEAEGDSFDLVGGFCFVVWDVHGSLYSLGRPGMFCYPLTPGRPAITPFGVRKGIYLSSACSWASSSSSDPKRVSQMRRPA
jgi:hypothetical protein